VIELKETPLELYINAVLEKFPVTYTLVVESQETPRNAQFPPDEPILAPHIALPDKSNFRIKPLEKEPDTELSTIEPNVKPPKNCPTINTFPDESLVPPNIVMVSPTELPILPPLAH
jgi:hypothetical protein